MISVLDVYYIVKKIGLIYQILMFKIFTPIWAAMGLRRRAKLGLISCDRIQFSDIYLDTSLLTRQAQSIILCLANSSLAMIEFGRSVLVRPLPRQRNLRLRGERAANRYMSLQVILFDRVWIGCLLWPALSRCRLPCIQPCYDSYSPPGRHFWLPRPICGGTSRFGQFYRGIPQREGPPCRSPGFI